MRITITELPNGSVALERSWSALVAHCAAAEPDLVLLPEMPFSPWLAAAPERDEGAWAAAVSAHEVWMERLGELQVRHVAGTRPVGAGEGARNEAFIWSAGGGADSAAGSILDVHQKVFLPEEDGFWEARWYGPGPREFREVTLELGSERPRVGFLICTEMWFMEHARAYGQAGVDLLLCPRATHTGSRDKWVAGGRAAATVSGAFCISSNFTGPADGGSEWAGTGWVIDPEEAEVLARTEAAMPFRTVDVDVQRARRAKETYPRYVRDPSSP
jgi:N-carbamoylputrescine amidase